MDLRQLAEEYGASAERLLQGLERIRAPLGRRQAVLQGVGKHPPPQFPPQVGRLPSCRGGYLVPLFRVDHPGRTPRQGAAGRPTHNTPAGTGRGCAI